MRSTHEYIQVALLCLINVINYTDRYTFGGILPAIKSEFNIDNDMAGLLQSCFTIVYMVSAPILGYVGDRFSRKILLSICVLLWSLAHLGSSFATIYPLLVLSRLLVGVGQAGFTAVAPTILSDFFVGNKLLRFLGYFYLAIPVGKGLSVAVSSEMYKATGNWEWSLRVTPGISLAAVILLMTLPEPKRGVTEGHDEEQPTSICEDLKYLVKNRSYMSSTLAFTCLEFASGVVYFWGPQLYRLGYSITNPKTSDNVVTYFGVLSIFSGVLGITTGYVLSFILKIKFSRADPLICAGGLFFAAPMFMASTFVINNVAGLYVLIFFGQLGLNLNWAILCDILLKVVTPRRKAIACGLQVFVGHTLGDAGSPYLFGHMSMWFKEHFKEKYPDAGTIKWEYWALQYSYFLPVGMLFVGGGLFAITAIFIVADIVPVKLATETEEIIDRGESFIYIES